MNRAMLRASRANGRNLMKQGWTPFEEVSQEIAERGIRPLAGMTHCYRNCRYIVQVFPQKSSWGVITLLMVRRNDEAPIHSWSDLQRIKNEIVGTEAVAVEVYPAESNLVDQANMYHLWVLPPDLKLPFGLHRGAA